MAKYLVALGGREDEPPPAPAPAAADEATPCDEDGRSAAEPGRVGSADPGRLLWRLLSAVATPPLA
jgi:hypothetical protein